MNNLIEIGKIVNIHGLRGDVKVVPWTDFPEIFEGIKKVYTDGDKSYKVKGVKYHKSSVLLKLEGIDTPELAERMRNKVLYADKELFEDLPDDTYLIADLIGVEVYDDEKSYGKITDVITTGGNDVYCIGTGKNQVLIPAIKDVVLDVDISAKKMLVKIPNGLLDD